MQKISLKKLFDRLCSTEYEFLKLINRERGSESGPLDYNEISATLNVDKRKLYSATKRLVNTGVLIAEGENFKINEEIYKNE